MSEEKKPAGKAEAETPDVLKEVKWSIHAGVSQASLLSRLPSMQCRTGTLLKSGREFSLCAYRNLTEVRGSPGS